MTEHKGIPGTAEAGGFQPWYLMNLFSALLWPGVFAVLLQTYALKITGSAADTGLIMGIGGIGALLSPVFGNIADRYRAHRPLQILAWAIVATSIATLAFSVNEMVFLVAALCFGVGMAPAGMISTVYVVGAGLSQESESRAMGAFQRMYFVGIVLGGFMVAGLLRSGLSDTVMFLICAGIAVICLFLALFTTRDIAARVADHAAQSVATATPTAPETFTLGDLVKSAFGLTVLAVFLNHVGFIAIAGQYTNFFSGGFGIDPSIVTSVNSLGVLGSLLVIGAVGKWMGRRGPIPAAVNAMAARAALGAALLATSYLLAGAGGALFLPMAIWVGFRLANPLVEMSNPVLAARTTALGAGQTQAILISAIAIAITVGNFLAGYLAETIGWLALPWQTVICCSLAFLVTRFAIAPRLHAGSNAPAPEMLMANIELEDGI